MMFKKWIYISRIDGNLVIYDLRSILHNGRSYLEHDGLNTFEHFFKTYVWNRKHSENIIWFGLMGVERDFIVRDAIIHENEKNS